MRIARNTALALAAAGALALGSAALAQDAQKPEAKAESGDCHGAKHEKHGAHQKHERRGQQEKHDHS